MKACVRSLTQAAAVPKQIPAKSVTKRRISVSGTHTIIHELDSHSSESQLNVIIIPGNPGMFPPPAHARNVSGFHCPRVIEMKADHTDCLQVCPASMYPTSKRCTRVWKARAAQQRLQPSRTRSVLASPGRGTPLSMPAVTTPAKCIQDDAA
jgi:hypothetical protein